MECVEVIQEVVSQIVLSCKPRGRTDVGIPKIF